MEVIYTVRLENQIRDVLSLLPSEETFEKGKGLSTQSIVGVFLQRVERGDFTQDNFSPNPEFIKFLHHVIAKYAPQLPELQAEAARQSEGCVYVIDGRAADPQGEVLPENIIGGFAVQAGKLLAGSYQPNSRHIVLLGNRLFILDERLHERLLEETRNSLL